MNRSKAFLGITTWLLAVVAFAATNAHKSFTDVKFGFYEPGFGCILDGNKPWYTFGRAGSHIAVTSSGELVVYTNSLCVGHTLFQTVTMGND
jgi:hypothetical protein